MGARIFCYAIVLTVFCPTAQAADAVVAVAANFVPVLQRLAPDFEASSGDRLRIIPGSTGKLYAQIRQGAPFDVFLAADRRRPQRLEQDGLTVAGSRFTYAIGRLVLWGRAKAVQSGLKVLLSDDIHRIAIAEPEVAPYGHAAYEALRKAGLWQRLQSKLIRGESISQAFHFVASGNADVGLVALSEVLSYQSRSGDGSYYLVPAADYTPLEQQAVLLKRGGHNPAARAFLAFMKDPRTRATIRDYGYGL
jgi:molybdate transport system substrate-binding protein